jgi:hypothetical protein
MARPARDVPPPLADVRGGDDGGAAAEESEYVEEELGGQPVDRPQLAPQDVDLLQDAVEEEFYFTARDTA